MIALVPVVFGCILGLVAYGCLRAGLVTWKLRRPVKSAEWHENSVAAIRERVERELAEAVPRDSWPSAADLRRATRLQPVQEPPFVPAQRVALSLVAAA